MCQKLGLSDSWLGPLSTTTKLSFTGRILVLKIWTFLGREQSGIIGSFCVISQVKFSFEFSPSVLDLGGYRRPRFSSPGWLFILDMYSSCFLHTLFLSLTISPCMNTTHSTEQTFLDFDFFISKINDLVRGRVGCWSQKIWVWFLAHYLVVV